MKKTKTETTYNCDLCGKKNIKPVKELKIPVSYCMDLVNTLILKDIHCCIPYGTTDGDVCENCFKKALKTYLK